MTPKQKAEDLLHKYMILEDNENNFNYDIKCALIAVDEILKAIPNEYLDVWQGETNMVINEDIEYWQEVKKELEEKIEL